MGSRESDRNATKYVLSFFPSRLGIFMAGFFFSSLLSLSFVFFFFPKCSKIAVSHEHCAVANGKFC